MILDCVVSHLFGTEDYFVGKKRECQSFSGAVLGDDTCCLLVLCSRILFNLNLLSWWNMIEFTHTTHICVYHHCWLGSRVILRWIWPLTQRQRGANLAASVDGEWQQKQLWANGIVWTPRRNWCFCLPSFSNIIWLLVLLWKGINDLPLPSNICFSWRPREREECYRIQCRWYSWHPQLLEASQDFFGNPPWTSCNPCKSWEKFGELSKRPFELSSFEGP